VIARNTVDADTAYVYYWPLFFIADGCHRTDEGEVLAYYFLTDTGQRRPIMECNGYLSASAQHHADDMVEREYWGHDTPEGETPNENARLHGCNLPHFYAKKGNNIESAELNKHTAESAWLALLDSQVHKQHLLGLHPFFREQTSYGVGYASSAWGTVWVIQTAICN
jgi:uncharacterized protein YkwD